MTSRSVGGAPDPIPLLVQVYQAGEALMRDLADVLVDLDLTQSQVHMLWALEPSSPPVSMREIARKLHFDPSNVTLLADRLEEAGLIGRTPHPTDGRQRVLALTPKGVKVWSLLIDELRKRSALFSLSEREQRQLLHLLTKAQGDARPR